jgi:NADH-quinone oxidoreductase subunit C
MHHDATHTKLKANFGDDVITSQFRDNLRVTVPPDKLFDLLKCLKQECGFDMLAELTAVDYLHYPNAKDRYGVVYCLTNIATGGRLVVKTFVNDPETVVPSCFSLWRGADWLEREVYDMFGIVFDGHPDLRRILMPDEFSDFALRKDYPLRGRGERHNFPAITRAES